MTSSQVSTVFVVKCRFYVLLKVFSNLILTFERTFCSLSCTAPMSSCKGRRTSSAAAADDDDDDDDDFVNAFYSFHMREV